MYATYYSLTLTQSTICVYIVCIHYPWAAFNGYRIEALWIGNAIQLSIQVKQSLFDMHRYFILRPDIEYNIVVILFWKLEYAHCIHCVSHLARNWNITTCLIETCFVVSLFCWVRADAIVSIEYTVRIHEHCMWNCVRVCVCVLGFVCK